MSGELGSTFCDEWGISCPRKLGSWDLHSYIIMENLNNQISQTYGAFLFGLANFDKTHDSKLKQYILNRNCVLQYVVQACNLWKMC